MKTFKKPLSKEQESRYIALSKQGDILARNKLIEYNLRLVAHIIKKYQVNNKDTEDYLSIGTIGLIKAIDSYDEIKGNRLATYASRCIENEILMYLRQERKEQRETSLFDPIGKDKEGNEVSLIDIIDSGEKPIINSIIITTELEQLSKIFHKVLTSREQLILSLRYGLFNNKAQTQKSIASSLNISRSYVSRIEKKALLKLRSALNE
ncbi:MAG: RNA polymerase sporulation sigma factor SigK [Lachnospiraceae bacterium]|nr:RNA polymerase sporulation sigma factor SigK [Lachnospiraceae bacterium]